MPELFQSLNLSADRDRLQSVLDAATSVSIIAGNVEGLITLFNSGAERMLGYKAEEMVGKERPSVFHLESEIIARGLELTAETGRLVNGVQVFLEKARNGQPEEREWTYVRKDGSHLTVNLVVTAALDTSGAITGFLGVAMDVTARKQAEAALRASEEHFRLIVDAVEDYSLLMLDAGGRVVNWNNGAQRMKGYQANEIIGRHFSVFHLPDAVASGHPAEALRIAAHEGRYTEEAWRVRKDGSRFFAHVIITAIRDEEGKLRGFAKVTRDITEREKAEKMSRDQAQILDLANDAIFIRDSQDRIIYWNQGAQRLYGWSKEEALGRVTHILLRTHFPQRLEDIKAQLLANAHWEGELVHTGRDGSLVTVASSWTIRRDDSRQPASVLELNYDITGRKNAEQQLEINRLRTNAILAGSLDGVVLYEAIRDNRGVFSDLKFALINPAAERMMRVDASGLIGQKLLEKMPSVAADGFFDKLAFTIQEDIPFDIEYLSRQDEEPRWYRVAGFKLGDGIALSYAEITARKQSEKELNILARRLSLATHVLQAGVWDWDVRTNLIEWDERMCEIYGIQKDTPINYKLWARAVLPEDLPQAEAALQSMIASQSQNSSGFRITLPNAALRHIQAAQGTVLDEAGQVARVVGVNIDITERKLNERLVAERSAQLEAANYELEQFAFAASHDLKAPLRVIENAARWLEEDLDEHLTPETRETMDLLRARVKRMEKLLDDLLEYARIGRATDARFAEIIAGDVLMENILGLLPPAGFAVNVSPSFAAIRVRRMPLQQILLNLMGNAIKHHDKKTGRIDVTVEDGPAHYTFAVKDDGPGIAAQFHEQIFQMFNTLKPRDQVEGSGMGLAMVRKNIEVYGGSLQLESAVGQGSTFRFTWPKQQHLKGDAPT